MDPIQKARALRATQVAQNAKRKSVSAAEVATPNKKIDTKLDAGQLSGTHRPYEATLFAEIKDMREQVVIKPNPTIRLELTIHANS